MSRAPLRLTTMSLRTPVLLLALSLLPTLAVAADVKVPTAVDEVTVHPSSAWVIRRGRVHVPAGDVRLVLEGLTPLLQDDSLRLATTGSARARLFGISVESRQHAEATSAELRASETEVRSLEDRDRQLVDRIQAAGKRREFLDGLRSTYVRERTENLGVRQTNPAEWKAMVDFVGQQTAAVLEEIRATEVERRELAGALAAARARLAQLQSKGARVDKQVVVDLHVQRAGTLELEATYVVSNATWRPVWDARLDPARETIELGLQARVEQRTGEDWSNVKLAVSTAQPERRVYVPTLEPGYLQKGVSYGARPSSAERVGKAQRSAASMDESAADAGLAPPPPVIEVGLISTSFIAPSRATLTSTGEPRNTLLASFPIESKLVRMAVPSTEPVAFLVAEGTNTTGVPLLAGPIELFVGNAFVGRTSLPDVPAGDKLKLAFGPDPRIKIERKVVDRTHEETGVFSKREVIRYRIRTTVKNLYENEVEVSLLDRLPVSRDEDIEVKVLEGTTKSTEPDDPMKPGVKTWRLQLAPGQEKVVELRFEVSFPRGQPIQGLP